MSKDSNKISLFYTEEGLLEILEEQMNEPHLANMKVDFLEKSGDQSLTEMTLSMLAGLLDASPVEVKDSAYYMYVSEMTNEDFKVALEGLEELNSYDDLVKAPGIGEIMEFMMDYSDDEFENVKEFALALSRYLTVIDNGILITTNLQPIHKRLYMVKGDMLTCTLLI